MVEEKLEMKFSLCNFFFYFLLSEINFVTPFYFSFFHISWRLRKSISENFGVSDRIHKILLLQFSSDAPRVLERWVERGNGGGI